MINKLENGIRNKHRDGASARRDGLVAAGLGLVAGSITKSVAIEVFAHQELAHHTLKVKPGLNRASRMILAMYGLSANKFALRHRKHHRTAHLDAKDSLLGGVSGAFASSGTNEGMIDPSSPEARHWNSNDSYDDTLSSIDGGKRVLRQNPWYERLASRGGVTGAIMPIAGVTAIYMAARASGSDKPGRVTASFIGASLIPMGLQPGITAYAEARAGIDNGRINSFKLGEPLRSRVERHDEHHAIPWRYDLGITPVDRLVIGVGKGLGLIDEIEIEEKQPVGSEG